MPEIVLRVRLIGGDHVDVTYEEAGAADPDTVAEYAIATLTQDANVLRPDMVTGLSCCTAVASPASR